MNDLLLSPYIGIRAQNAGMFVSCGSGMHPKRTIASHELIFVTGGVLGMREEANTFELHAGQTILLWPGREHAGTTLYTLETAFYWVHFDMPTSGTIGDLSVPQVSSVARPDVLTALFRRFLDDQETGLLSTEGASHLIALMLQEVARTPFERERSGKAAVLAGRAMQYIVQHFADPHLSASRIARVLDCHPDHLGRCFRDVYSTTVTDTIHARRLRRARSLLMDSNASVDEVARACGFPGTAFFRRIFRRYEGITPSAYRIQYARVHLNTE